MAKLQQTLVGMFCALGLVVIGCESPDELNEEEVGLDLAEVEEPILFTVCNQFDGPSLGYGAIQNGTLSNTNDNGIQTEYIFKHDFMATAGQTVTFALEVPASTGGAWLALAKDAGASCSSRTYLAQAKSTSEGRVHFNYTFTKSGAYDIVVRQATPVFPSSLSYKIGADAPICRTTAGYEIDQTPPWPLITAQNFPVGTVENPWANPGDESWQVDTLTVSLGTCASLVNPSCGTAGPEIFYWEMPVGEITNVPNLCHAWNHVYEIAGTEYNWGVWWTFCSDYPEYC